MNGEKSPALLNIVLVEPQIPQNTGNIARTCAVTGAALHLVKPMGFVIDDKKLRRAGLDYWDKLDISYYDGMDDFFARNPGTALRIPMRPTLRSLNLSNSAAIAAYEVLRQWDYPDMQETGELRSFDWADAKTERE